VPIWLSQSILLIGFSMLTWRFIELFIAILKNQAVGFQLADEAKDSMHLIDEAAKSISSEQKENDKDTK
jgi:C4-dicarboxylate transporter DctQ subunit